MQEKRARARLRQSSARAIARRGASLDETFRMPTPRTRSREVNRVQLTSPSHSTRNQKNHRPSPCHTLKLAEEERRKRKKAKALLNSFAALAREFRSSRPNPPDPANGDSERIDRLATPPARPKPPKDNRSAPNHLIEYPSHLQRPPQSANPRIPPSLQNILRVEWGEGTPTIWHFVHFFPREKNTTDL